MTELTSAVRAAQAEADRRFGDGPVPPWAPPPVLSDATRRWLAVVAVASVLATALLVAIAVAQTTPAAEPAPVEPSTPSRADTSADAPEDEVPSPTPTAPTPAAPAAAPRLALERRGADWHLSAQGATRQEVVQRLAQASGATLHGWPEASATARTVQLQWQGRSLAQLWPVVLGPELNFALQCRRERCDVWILGAVRPGHASTTPVGPAAAFEPPALPLPMPGADEDNAPVRD